MLMPEELRGVPVVVRDDSAKFLFPLDFTFTRWSESNVKNSVSDFLALMRPREVIMRFPFPVDVVKVGQYSGR